METKAELAGLKAGDVLVCSWGYGMTMKDFYLVTKAAAVGKFTEVQRLHTEDTPSGFLCGESVPKVPHVPKGAALKKKVAKDYQGGACVKIETYATARLWDGCPEYYNHCD
jgi:hypothetical protein